MRTHTWEKPYICQECGVISSLNGSIKAHIHSDTWDELYKCHECEARFSQNYILNTISSKILEKSKHLREVCSKMFTEQWNERAYAYSYRRETIQMRGGEFSKKINTKVHLRTHTVEKPFNCECKTGFAQISHFKYLIGKKVFVKAYACFECEARFSQSIYFKYHMAHIV